MRVLIADDERPARDELAYLLGQIEGVDIVGQAASGEEVLEQVRALEPEVLFLDIQMPDASGVDVARQLLREGLHPAMVFATAFDRYAVEAFDVNAVDYLLKPIHEERLVETISRIRKRLEGTGFEKGEPEVNPKAEEHREFQRKNEPEEFLKKLDFIYRALNLTSSKLKIEENGKIYLIPGSDILYATIDERQVRVVTRQKSYLTNYSLSELEEILGASFLRVHKSYLANVEQIESIVPWFNNTYNLIMKDQQEIPVSRTYIKNFRQRLDL